MLALAPAWPPTFQMSKISYQDIVASGPFISEPGRNTYNTVPDIGTEHQQQSNRLPREPLAVGLDWQTGQSCLYCWLIEAAVGLDKFRLDCGRSPHVGAHLEAQPQRWCWFLQVALTALPLQRRKWSLRAYSPPPAPARMLIAFLLMLGPPE